MTLTRVARRGRRVVKTLGETEVGKCSRWAARSEGTVFRFNLDVTTDKHIFTLGMSLEEAADFAAFVGHLSSE